MNKKVVHFKKLNRAEEKNSENEIFLLGQDYVNDNKQNFLALFPVSTKRYLATS